LFSRDFGFVNLIVVTVVGLMVKRRWDWKERDDWSGGFSRDLEKFGFGCYEDEEWGWWTFHMPLLHFLFILFF